MKVMKKCLFILCVLLCASSLSAMPLVFDDLTNAGRISYKSNILITGGMAMISNWWTNSAAADTGYLITMPITKPQSNLWNLLVLNYQITNTMGPLPPKPKITLMILATNNFQLYNADNPPVPLNLQTVGGLLDYNSLILKIYLKEMNTGNQGTPLVNSYEVTVTNLPSVNAAELKNVSIKFYAAPAPLRIENSSATRFYYRFARDCTADLLIYDTNYNLVRKVSEGKPYTAGSYLDAVWDAKNGAGLNVISGVYIAILEIKNSDGSKESPDPFAFAVIR